MTEQNLERLEKAEEEWNQGTVKEFLSRMPERREEFTTLAGIPVKRLYTPLDVKGLDYLKDIGFPGEYPFTRGPYPTMHRARFWTFRPETGRDSPEATNIQFKKIINDGATGLSMGPNYTFITNDVDPDDPAFWKRYGATLGRSGICYSTLKDWEIILDGIPLDGISLSLNDPHFTARSMAFFIAAAKKQGVPPEQLTGNCENDPLQLYYANHYETYPVEHSLRLFVDLAEYCCKHMPRWNLTSLSAYNRGECGINAVQDLQTLRRFILHKVHINMPRAFIILTEQQWL